VNYTDNYNLRKPELTDPVDIDDLNYNADEIDSLLKGLADGLDGITPEGIGAETPTGAQQKANQAETNAKSYADIVANGVLNSAKDYADIVTNNALNSAKDYADGVLESANSHTDQVASDLSQKLNKTRIKVLDVEQDVSNINKVLINLNPNHEAKQTVSGYGTVTLPKNAANGQFSDVRIKGRTLKNELNYNRDTWAEWTKSAGVVADATGIEITADGANYVSAIIGGSFKPSTKYGILLYCVSSSLTDGVYFGGISTLDFSNIGISNIRIPVGNYRVITTSKPDLSAGKNFRVSVKNTETNGNKIKLRDIRVFELPTGSEIEADFTNLTADQLAQKYPYIKGDSPKSTISASRLRSVSEDETQESTQYLPNVGELRSLPNGTKDEINVTDRKLIKRIGEKSNIANGMVIDFADMAEGGTYYAWNEDGETETGIKGDTLGIDATTLTYQLAEPVEIPIEVSGTLLSHPSGTVYIEPVVADAGVYTDKMEVLHQDLPIKAIENVSKVDFLTGVETELDIDGIVIAEDKFSFTHPDLVAGDIVFFEYEYDVESTQGEAEVEYYDSRYTIKDSVTDKFYKWNVTVADGVPSIELVEV
jgi:hypothetical protein